MTFALYGLRTAAGMVALVILMTWGIVALLSHRMNQYCQPTGRLRFGNNWRGNLHIEVEKKDIGGCLHWQRSRKSDYIPSDFLEHVRRQNNAPERTIPFSDELDRLTPAPPATWPRSARPDVSKADGDRKRDLLSKEAAKGAYWRVYGFR